ncbi:MAG: hypothetical protein ACJATP_001643, partial [Candidatus Azotimanducaceae bacterium]
MLKRFLAEQVLRSERALRSAASFCEFWDQSAFGLRVFEFWGQSAFRVLGSGASFGVRVHSVCAATLTAILGGEFRGRS